MNVSYKPGTWNLKQLINKTRLKTLNRTVYLGLLLIIGSISGCEAPPPEPGIGEIIAWSDLPGWTDDSHAEAWPALLQQCDRMANEQAQWEKICQLAETIAEVDDQRARRFFEKHFVAHAINPSQREDGSPGTGLVTGYYEPLLRGSLVPGGPYQHALYARPDDLVRIGAAGP